MSLVIWSAMLGCVVKTPPLSPQRITALVQEELPLTRDTTLRLMTQSGHRASPVQVAWSTAADLVATGGEDGLIVVWDAYSGRQLQIMRGPGASVTDLHWMEDHDGVLSLDAQGRLQVWAVSDGEPLWGDGVSDLSDAFSAAVSPGGDTVVVGTSGGQLWMLDTDGYLQNRIRWGHRGEVLVHYTEDGRLISADSAGRLHIGLRSVDEEPLQQTVGAAVVALASYREWLLTADATGEVCAWWIPDGRQTKCVRIEGAYGLSALRDGRLVVQTDTPEAGLSSEIRSLGGDVLERDSRWLRFDGAAYITDVTDIIDSPHGLLLGRTDGTARIVRPDGELVLRGQVGLGQQVTFGNRLLLSGGAADSQSLWDIQKGRIYRTLSTPRARAAALSADDSRLVVLGADGALQVLDPESEVDVRRIVFPRLDPHALSLSGDGHRALLADDAGNVRLISLEAEVDEPPLWQATLKDSGTPLLSLHPDGDRAVVVTPGGHVRVWQGGFVSEDTGFAGPGGQISSVTLSDTGGFVVLAGARLDGRQQWRGAVWCYRLDGQLVSSWQTDHPVLAVTFLAPDVVLATTAEGEMFKLRPSRDGEIPGQVSDNIAPDRWMSMVSLSLHPQGWLAGGRIDGGAMLWRKNQPAQAMRLLAFAETGSQRGPPEGVEGTSARLIDWGEGYWATVHPESRRFDAAFAGEMSTVYWVMRTQDGALEPIPLSRLKETSLHPGLLRDVLGGMTLAPIQTSLPEPPGVRLLRQPSFTSARYPAIRVCLTERSGGIGRVFATLNGRQIFDEIYDEIFDDLTLIPGEGCPTAVEIPLESQSALLKPAGNEVVVQAYAACEQDNCEAIGGFGVRSLFDGPRVQVLQPAEREQTHTGTGITRVRVERPINPPPDRPTMFVLVVGISAYSDEALKLDYPAKDANTVADLFQIAGEKNRENPARIFERLEVVRLIDDGASTPGHIIRRAEALIAQQRPGDTFGIYLAGHGVVDEEGSWFFLTQHATMEDLTDRILSDENALSTASLQRLFQKSPAENIALVLDTCAAGAAAGILADPRGSQLSLQDLKDRTGLTILAASTGDGKAYESDPLGHGLLTAGLIQGLQNETLAGLYDGRWMAGALFSFVAEEVPRLAERFGLPQNQQPVLARPISNDFPIGLWDRGLLADEHLLFISQPQITSTVMIDSELFGDPLGLGEAVDAALAGGAQAGGYQITAAHSSAVLQLWGTYRQTGEGLILDVGLLRGDEVLARSRRLFSAEPAEETTAEPTEEQKGELSTDGDLEEDEPPRDLTTTTAVELTAWVVEVMETIDAR